MAGARSLEELQQVRSSRRLPCIASRTVQNDYENHPDDTGRILTSCTHNNPVIWPRGDAEAITVFEAQHGAQAYRWLDVARITAQPWMLAHRLKTGDAFVHGVAHVSKTCMSLHVHGCSIESGILHQRLER